MLRLNDKGQDDDKILAVPATDPHYEDYHDLPDLPRHYPTAVEHFFITYKQLQEVQVKSMGWVGVKEAREAILHAIQLYRETFPPQRI
jgi:inorganic pyrophosphatase